MPGLTSGDWKRSHGANCDTGAGESRRKQSSLAAYSHRASRRLYQGEHGPLLDERYPALAKRMYDRNVRVLIHTPSPATASEASKVRNLDRDVRKILSLALAVPPSHRPSEQEFRDTSGKCHPKSRHVRTTDDCRPLKRRSIRVECDRKPE